MKNWLYDSTVIITGVGGGMGKGIAKKLITEYRCFVIGVDISQKGVDCLIEELGDYKNMFIYHLFDVGKKENWETFANNITEKNITIDLLINNAGILPKFNRFGNYTLDYINLGMNVNFFASVYSCHYLLPIIMKSKKGGIVNVSSSASLCTLPGTSVYSASKSALKAMTEAIRDEYSDKLYVGLVCPGFTKTNIFSSQNVEGTQPKFAENAIDMISMDCGKMVNKIVKGIKRKKKRMVFGVDAHLMEEGNKIAPTITPYLSGKIMKLSGHGLFADIFK